MLLRDEDRFDGCDLATVVWKDGKQNSREAYQVLIR
jgi:hypothetical protein